MSYGGSVLGMIISLKNNAKLISKRRTLQDLGKDYRYKIGKPLKFKELPEPELLELKARIKRDILKQRRRNTIKSILFLFVIIGSGWLILSLASDLYLESYLEEKKELKLLREEQLKGSPDYTEQVILFCLNKGYKSLDNGDYGVAKYHFDRAKRYDEYDFRVIIANAQVYVYDCIYNGEDCDRTQSLLNNLKEKYSAEPEVMDLIELYNDEK